MKGRMNHKMSYKNDNDIINRLQEHLEAVLNAYPEMDWFVLVAQGSMNYGLMDEESDVDSKLAESGVESKLVNKL